MPPDFERDVRCILGLPFDVLTEGQAEAKLRASFRNRTRCVLATPNLNFAMSCLGDTEFRNSVLRSDMSVADGWPIVAVARLLRIPLPERVAGSDLFERLRRGSPEQAVSIYFFGGPPGVAETACKTLNAGRSGMLCVGADAPGFGTVSEMSTDDHLSRLNAAHPDFVVVALGAKKGHAWIERNQARIDAPVISHLGAVVNFTAGTVSRAPRSLQRTGFEWLWRITQEPALWRRYASDGSALLRVLVTRILPCALHARLSRFSAGSITPGRVTSRLEGDHTVISLEGAWTVANGSALRTLFRSADVLNRSLEWDLSAATHLDSAAIGLLALLHGAHRATGLGWKIIAISPAARRRVSWACADYLLDTAEFSAAIPVPS